MRITAIQSLTGPLQSLRLLLAAVIVVPLALFAGAAWLSHRWTFDEAQAELSRTTDAVHEHALKVFETNALILDGIADRYGDLDWDAIVSSDAVHRYLKRLDDAVPQISAIGFIAPDGRIVSTNLDLPPQLAAHHDFLPIHRAAGDDLFISDLSVGTDTKTQQFLEARHMPDGARAGKGGMVFVAMYADYFKRYYEMAFGPDYAINIIRTDGALLARAPDLPQGMVLSPETGFRRAIAADPGRGGYFTRSAVDHRDRLYRYRRLEGYPLYVAVGIDYATITDAWWDKMSSHLIYGVPATLALILITIVALRRTERERAALLQASEEAKRRRQLEASLHQAQKMEAVGQLTGGVAHDFNNLLTAIMGGLEIILHASESTEAIRKYAGAAMRAAERGARLTQQLLAFSRRQILRPEIVNVNRVLGEFETLMQRAVGESIQFTCVLDPEADPCRIDPAQFQSAMLNLVVNARDATPAGGRVSIETRNVMLGQEAADVEVAPGRYVMIAVGDTGAGMTADVRAQAFDPFFTTKEVGKGSGLGLSQVYGFAKQSGGHVAVESEPGRGTTVRVYLPSVKASVAAQAEAGATVEPAAARPATVLVVEDEEAVLDAVVAGVKQLGYRTLAARDAHEALAILQRDEPIDLLFTDIAMPGGMNGIALAREARRLRQDIKVLLTSGYAAGERAGDGFDVLSKPYRQSQLAAMIAGVLGRLA